MTSDSDATTEAGEQRDGIRYEQPAEGAEVKQWIITEGYEPQYGARPMRRTIQKRLGDPLSEELIRGRFKDAKKIKVMLSDEEPVFVEEEAMAGV